MNRERVDILGTTSDSFVNEAGSRGLRRPGALDLYRKAFREGVCGAEWIDLDPPHIVRKQIEGETTKFILGIEGGLETESVILPMRSRTGTLSHTLCVSSQVGCAMGCAFCETAQMGLLKNLNAAQIIAQWFAARHHFGVAVRNIVFMGMGEPMDNLDAVERAVRVLADRNGPAIAPADIAVSTVGRTAGIRRYAALAAEEGFGKLKLAVSINAPNDAVRSSIMPINRAEPLTKLMDAMRQWIDHGGTPILIEYVLIPGMNDAPGHAAELADLLSPLECKINVIPYNPRRDTAWPAPAEDAVDAFVGLLRERSDKLVTRRRTLGRGVMAACGQLGNPGVRRRQFVSCGGESSHSGRPG